MLRRVKIGANDEDATVRFMRVAGPDFLTINNKVITVFNRPRLQRGEVRS